MQIVKWLAVKTASEMTYTVSGGALNSTQSNHADNIIVWANMFSYRGLGKLGLLLVSNAAFRLRIIPPAIT